MMFTMSSMYTIELTHEEAVELQGILEGSTSPLSEQISRLYMCLPRPGED